MKIGFHVSISGSIDKAVDRALELECSTFQIFSRNPRSGSSKPLKESEICLFKKKLKESKINPVFIHMPYIFNLASPNKIIYNKSIESLKEEISRCNQLNVPFIVLHLGSSLSSNRNDCIERIVKAIKNELSENLPRLLLENNSGTKNSIGSKFEEIGFIIKEINDPRVGFCLDTCHAFVAGYDLRNKDKIDETLDKINKYIGLENLKLIHLNDSIGDYNSGIDRHEHIGLGKIGFEGFFHILNSTINNIPVIMETPIDDRRKNAENMKVVKNMLKH